MNKQKLAREKLLFRYHAALERGDFETVGAVLAAAERDPALEQAVIELHAAFTDTHPLLQPSARSQEQNNMMQATFPLYTTSTTWARRRPVSTRFAPQRGLFSLAAVITVVLFAGLLISRLPSSGASGGTFIGGANLSPNQQAGQATVCTVIIDSANNVPLRSRPALEASVILLLESGSTVGVIETYSGSDPRYGVTNWIYVQGMSLDSGVTQGWINAADGVFDGSTCLPFSVVATVSPTPMTATRPSDAVPPPGEGGSTALLPPTPVPTVDGQPPLSAPPPGQGLPVPMVVPQDFIVVDGQCMSIAEAPFEIFAQADAQTPLLTVPGGTPLQALTMVVGEARFQAALQIGDITLTGGWVDSSVLVPARACDFTPRGIIPPPIDAQPPQDAVPPAGN